MTCLSPYLWVIDRFACADLLVWQYLAVDNISAIISQLKLSYAQVWDHFLSEGMEGALMAT
jgi:hypothetical protein